MTPTARTIGAMPVAFRLLLVLLGEAALVVMATTPWRSGLALIAVLALYAAVRLPWRRVWATWRTPLLLALVVGVLQAVVLGVGKGFVIGAQLFVAIALAALLTLTTSVSDLLATLERGLAPLRRFGVDPARVSLVLGLTISTVPVIGGLAGRIREASRARGVRLTPLAYGTALVIATVRHAEAVGAALVARGVDD